MNTNPQAKRVLCFGDSYTWGYNPDNNFRFAVDKRWPGVLQNQLGLDWEVIEEGLNSRTIISNDTRPGKEGRVAKDVYQKCLESHSPLDFVVLFMGTNELKDQFNMDAQRIGDALEQELIEPAIKLNIKIVLVCPPPLDLKNEYVLERYSNAGDKMRELPSAYQKLAQKFNCIFLNAGEVTTVGSDGVHLDEENNAKLGIKIAQVIKASKI